MKRVPSPWMLGLVLLCGVAPNAAAQAACTIDSARARVERDLVYDLRRWDGADTSAVASAVDHLLLAQDLAEVLVPPPQLSFWPTAGTFMRNSNADPTSGDNGVFAVEAAPDGGLKSFRWQRASSSPELASAVETAVRRLGEQQRLPTAVPDRKGVPKFELRIGTARPMAPPSIALFQTRVTGLQLDRDVEIESAGRLEMPSRMGPQWARARVELEYVVGPNGRADLEQVRVVQSPDPALAKASLAAIRTSRYRPAEIQGCPVAQLVQQGFNFTTQ